MIIHISKQEGTFLNQLLFLSFMFDKFRLEEARRVLNNSIKELLDTPLNELDSDEMIVDKPPGSGVQIRISGITYLITGDRIFRNLELFYANEYQGREDVNLINNYRREIVNMLRTYKTITNH